MAARKKKTGFNWQKFILERRSSLFSGILALSIIVGAFFLLNDISQTSKTEKTTKAKQTNSTSNKKETKPTTKPSGTKTASPTTHTVTAGESLWTIAENTYHDGYRWTLLASENGLTNPDELEVGMVLKLPSVDAEGTTPAVTNTQKEEKSPVTYVVKKGDCLWTIAENYYGTGFHWVSIRDANKTKVGLLPNGYPLITPGTLLTIPPS